MLGGSSENSGSADSHHSWIRRTLLRISDEDNQKRRRSSFAVAAGWMIIIAGILSFFNGLRTLLGETSWNLLDVFVDLNRYSICAVLVMLFGAVSIVGGISALRGRNLSLALAGAALGMIGDGVAGFWLGIGAILFLFLSSEDF